MPETTTTKQWEHDPTRQDHNHVTDGACFGCWCYGCGFRTDGPRDMSRGNQSPDLENPTSHRWCFE